jgi:hypothetical protein
MRQNIFMGGGFFAPMQAPSFRPVLGQFQWNRFSRPIQSSYQWTPRPGPIQRITRPTGQPAAAAAGASDVHCYFCENLPGAPTYWLSEAQASQWNSARDARCEQVSVENCRQKYGQLRAQQQASFRRVAPSFTQYAVPTYGSMLTGIRVENPELIG